MVRLVSRAMSDAQPPSANLKKKSDNSEVELPFIAVHFEKFLNFIDLTRTFEIPSNN